jgi:acetate kinase
MGAAVLVINAGSSSIKFAVFMATGEGDPELLWKGQMEGLGTDPSFRVKDAAGQVVDDQDHWPRGSTFSHEDGIRFILDWLDAHRDEVEIVAAGHRVVHGGLNFSAATAIDATVLNALEALVALAPLHQPHNLSAIRAIAALDPSLPQVACFDTAFHRTQPLVAQLFALPRTLFEKGIRRYGFHGLSYAYIARRLPQVLPDAARVVVAHLGSGASMCAIRNGQSVDSTMGFTAVDGLPMGTRSGAIDPGAILYLMEELKFDAKALETLLYRQSGLLGVSGISNDMRDLLASEDARAAEAIDLFVYQIARQLGALAASLQGLDALVFTAGIGENAPAIRDRVCQLAAWLGIRLDEAANQAGGPCISVADSPVSVWVLATDEEKMIAIDTLSVLKQRRPALV